MTKSIIMSLLVVAVFSSTSAFAQMGAGMMGNGMMGAGQGGQPENAGAWSAGAMIFREHCAGCHPGGGNVLDPSLPLKGSSALTSLRTFVDFIRHPKMPDGSQGSMPDFSRSEISDSQAGELYGYVISAGFEGRGGRGTRGMRRGMMVGGYGMRPGMMGGYGYGMGRGMMAPGSYSYSPECQKFYDETVKLRKELNDKRFEYFEAVRNPRTTGETALRIEKEMRDLQEKVFSKAPLGCWW